MVTNDSNNTDKSFIKNNKWLIIPGIILMGSILFIELKSIWSKNKEKTEWQEKDFKEMVDQCVTDSKTMAIKYPELTKNYCICSIKQIQSKFSKQEYITILSKTIAEQEKNVLPAFQSCLIEYQNKIKELDNK